MSFGIAMTSLFEVIMVLGLIGWILAGIAAAAIWVQRDMRKAREREKQRAEKTNPGKQNDPS